MRPLICQRVVVVDDVLAVVGNVSFELANHFLFVITRRNGRTAEGTLVIVALQFEQRRLLAALRLFLVFDER